MTDTITIIATFGFLKTVERSTSFVDRLPIFGNASLIMKRVTASCLPYLAEEPKQQNVSIKRADEITTRDFDEIFPVLVDDLVEHAKAYGVPRETLDWYKNSLQHNVLGGKANRGKSVIDASADLLGRPLTDDEYFRSAILGWCTELLQAALLVADDIMDSSQTRRGNTCWYRMPNVGMNALNDAFMLVSSIFVILQKYFHGDKNYIHILELFHEVMFKTEIGQLADLLTAPEEKLNFDQFSFEKYRFIVNFKTSYYSFFLPATLSLYQLNLATPKNLQQAEKILLLTGEYFQVQDDYLDGYGVPEIIGKIGTDIQDNKCSWLINEALKRASQPQRKVLEDNYGRKDASAEAKVKDIYNEMDLESVYRKYEDEKVLQIKEAIYAIDESEGLKKSIFEGFLNKIYKRSKEHCLHCSRNMAANNGSEGRRDNYEAFFQHNNSSETLNEGSSRDIRERFLPASGHFWPSMAPTVAPGPFSGPTMIPVPTIMENPSSPEDTTIEASPHPKLGGSLFLGASLPVRPSGFCLSRKSVMGDVEHELTCPLSQHLASYPSVERLSHLVLDSLPLAPLITQTSRSIAKTTARLPRSLPIAPLGFKAFKSNKNEQGKDSTLRRLLLLLDAIAARALRGIDHVVILFVDAGRTVQQWVVSSSSQLIELVKYFNRTYHEEASKWAGVSDIVVICGAVTFTVAVSAFDVVVFIAEWFLDDREKSELLKKQERSSTRSHGKGVS
ncbi:uncharacterized protein KY384_006511 [Bacidia gigantensis]|uniref:uncharacterized protein n=1 Tax=Bacidia gigantensis TaxID=2732470 RepID=UPI001D045001|nr:uncharacterized protein KY384_006511 [Bacidia gigantensis]KAG8528822.1 hypothetical protein KY384_006511 [Bacidia gigantensis]